MVTSGIPKKLRGQFTRLYDLVQSINIFMNDKNEAVNDSSLRLYADDTTQYIADKSPTVLQLSLNQDMERLSSWLDHNYLQANGDKTQAMVLGKVPTNMT